MEGSEPEKKEGDEKSIQSSGARPRVSKEGGKAILGGRPFGQSRRGGVA